MATAGAGATPPPPLASQQQQQQERMALFEAKYAELVAEARGVAREFGASVRTIAFRPAGAPGPAAVSHDVVGRRAAAREALMLDVIGREVRRDAAGMGAEEAEQHRKRLFLMRTLVLRELQAKKTKAAVVAAAAAAAGGDGGKARREPPAQQDADAGAAAGSNKIRRMG